MFYKKKIEKNDFLNFIDPLRWRPVYIVTITFDSVSFPIENSIVYISGMDFCCSYTYPLCADCTFSNHSNVFFFFYFDDVMAGSR